MEATFPFRQPTSTESSDIMSADPAASFECFLMLVDAFLLSIMFEKNTQEIRPISVEKHKMFIFIHK